MSDTAGHGWTKTCVILLDTEVRKAEGAAQTSVTTETEDPLFSVNHCHCAIAAGHSDSAQITHNALSFGQICGRVVGFSLRVSEIV